MLIAAQRHRHRSFLLPGPGHDVEAALKEERMQKRREELENTIKTQHFYDWLAAQKEKHPDSNLATDPVWYVFLLELEPHFINQAAVQSALTSSRKTRRCEVYVARMPFTPNVLTSGSVAIMSSVPSVTELSYQAKGLSEPE